MANNYYENLSEDGHEIIHTLYDKFGDAYTLEGHLSASGLTSDVYCEMGWVGRINLDVQDNVMTIADIIIDYIGKKPLWAQILPRLYKKPDYRGRGLGSAMLEFIIESARAMGVSKIEGRMDTDSRRPTDYLPQFYRKHGFIVDDNRSYFYQVLE